MHEVKIITFQRGYPTIVEQAEATIAHLLDQGWQLGTGGGSASTGFVVLLRQVVSPGEGLKKGVSQPAPPAPAPGLFGGGGTPRPSGPGSGSEAPEVLKRVALPGLGDRDRGKGHA